ncbi:MAG: hypothetical protein KGZ37_02725, partial [Nitrosarchaeum sp.]|nr:hypothetical protein [Nitrosarchaeum sp.]
MKLNKIFVVAIMSLLLVSVLGQQVLGYGGTPEQNSSGNYVVNVHTDKEFYSLGESIIFSGTVNKYDEDRTLQISIFDSNQNFVVTKKISVNDDASFSHNFMLDKKFLDGEYVVKTQYGNSKVTVGIISFVINSNDVSSVESKSFQDTKIPDWIKSNAGWWAAGQIDDNSFVQGIQFLIKEGLMKIPISEQGSVSQDTKIPDWIKSNAGWWAAGQIDDNSFVQGIQFLIKEGLM